jgi:regulator of cell morphogenesis and NO signaling
MSSCLNPTMTVGQLVTDRPARSRIFESLNIDYCCGGKRSLAEACAKRQLEPAHVMKLIASADQAADALDNEVVDADAMTLAELADHIERTHHAFLRSELPRLDAITEKVSRVHGDREPRLREVRQAFCAFRDELSSHMLKEERILFPMIRALQHASTRPAFGCGSIANPIHQMESEHQHAGDALATMRAATDDYQPPPWACNTYRAMLDGLANLERDMHQHVHKENNVLFPKAIACEGKLK